MKAYGYEVEGSSEALVDVDETMQEAGCRINWKNFNTGDFYWTGNGARFLVNINHETKRVELVEE